MNEHSEIITFASALFFGIFFIIISKRLKIPSIVTLLLGGVLLGPSIVGIQLINPASLGDGLGVIIKLTVAIILFEGGLTLDINGYKIVSSGIRRSLSWGVLITWIATAITIRFLFEFQWSVAILSASLIIVTGPTVIVPLLKRINVNKKLHNYLHWEGVLIDPIGVFIALLTYEWIIGHQALMLFVLRIITGLGLGTLWGLGLAWIMNKRLIADDHLNAFILSSALLLFTISDIILAECGLMSVVVTGFVIGYIKPPQLESVKIYKEQLSELLIGLLFILLAANLDLNSFSRYNPFKLGIAVFIVMLIIRPLNIFISTVGTKQFTFREQLFLSWIAPRGIVAASMASLFALNMKQLDTSDFATSYDFLEAFTYSVIVGTVIFQGFSAKLVGKFLKVLEPKPTGWAIIGAHTVAQQVGSFIKKHGFAVTFIDTNLHTIKTARQNGLSAIIENALTIDIDDYPELYGTGNVLAITKNENLNQLVCQLWQKKLSKPSIYQWRLQINKELNENDGALITGSLVWGTLELNKITSTKIDQDYFTTITKKTQRITIKHPERVLASSVNGIIYPYLPDDAETIDSFIIYHPFHVKLEINIRPEWLIYSEAKNYQEVINELLQILHRDFNKIDITKLEATIVRQEKEFSSVIGYNTALPHSYIDGIDESLVLMAKLVQPVPCIYSNEEVHFVFLVLSPKNMPDTHIKILSNISKFMLNDYKRDSLYQAGSFEDLQSIFFK